MQKERLKVRLYYHVLFIRFNNLLGLAPIDRNRPKHSKADEEAKQNIQARERKLNLEAKIGKTEVTQGLGSNKQPGYYCQHCDVTLKDSASWLDHINSKRRK